MQRNPELLLSAETIHAALGIVPQSVHSCWRNGILDQHGVSRIKIIRLRKGAKTKRFYGLTATIEAIDAVTRDVKRNLV